MVLKFSPILCTAVEKNSTKTGSTYWEQKTVHPTFDQNLVIDGYDMTLTIICISIWCSLDTSHGRF